MDQDYEWVEVPVSRAKRIAAWTLTGVAILSGAWNDLKSQSQKSLLEMARKTNKCSVFVLNGRPVSPAPKILRFIPINLSTDVSQNEKGQIEISAILDYPLNDFILEKFGAGKEVATIRSKPLPYRIDPIATVSNPGCGM
jgi:hypothetical protein